MTSGKADMPRGLLAQIQMNNEEASEKKPATSILETNKEDGPVKAMTKEEEVSSMQCPCGGHSFLFVT